MRCPPSRVAAPEHCERLEQRFLFATVPAGFTDAQLATGLSSPTAMEFAPDGRLFICQQGGALRIFKDGALLTTPFMSLTVDSGNERGLLGIAFDPNFAANRHLYVYYTVPASAGGPYNRISRFTASSTNPDVVEAGSEVLILRISQTLTNSNHNGGAIHFGSDGKLYAAVGEDAVTSNAQTLNNLLGKMLRINPDGTPPSDNPFFTNNDITEPRDYIWALGLRNPFTFAVQPGTGRIFINDVGSSGTSRREEVNDGIAGSNYGWPTIEGFRTTQTLPTIGTYRDPVHAYNPSDIGGNAITGGAFYNPATPHFPIGYVGDYFFGDLGAGVIRHLDLGTSPPPVTTFGTGSSSQVDIKVGPDGRLYYLARTNGRLGRISATTPAAQTPVINDGHVQRSKVNEITVNFTRGVTLDSGAITVTGLNGAGTGVIVNVTPVDADTYTVSFTGTSVIGGSLPDGIYDLMVDATKVHDVQFPAQSPAAHFTHRFHRLFSDSDGDGDSDNADLFQARSTYGRFTGQTGFLAWWDYENDGDVDNADIFQVRSRRSITFVY